MVSTRNTRFKRDYGAYRRLCRGKGYGVSGGTLGDMAYFPFVVSLPNDLSHPTFPANDH